MRRQEPKMHGMIAALGTVYIVALGVAWLLQNPVLDLSAAACAIGATLIAVFAAFDVMAMREYWHGLVDRLFGELDEATDTAEAATNALDNLLVWQEQQRTAPSYYDGVAQALIQAPSHEAIRDILSHHAGRMMQEAGELRQLAEARLDALRTQDVAIPL